MKTKSFHSLFFILKRVGKYSGNKTSLQTNTLMSLTRMRKLSEVIRQVCKMRGPFSRASLSRMLKPYGSQNEVGTDGARRLTGGEGHIKEFFN